MQDYSYAINENSILTKIDDAIKGQKYFCPYCNAPMVPRQGAKRKWHYAHKPDIEHPCCYESYLHKLAKLQIKNCFDNTNQFHITFSPKTFCSIHNCPLNARQPCSWPESKTFELKHLYDTCSIEKGINGFIADLILSSSEYPDRPPIIIEIFVKHKSSEEKIKSGLRIIEIKIQSEKDISDILDSCSISEKVFFKNDWSDGIDVVKFHNFKGYSFKMPSEKHQQSKFHFWIDEKLYFHLDSVHYYNYDYFCLSPIREDLNDAVFRIDSSEPLDLDFAFNELVKSGLNIRFCNMCDFYKFNDFLSRSLCVLYKSKGTDKHPKLSYANICPHFTLRHFDPHYMPEDFAYNILIKTS